MIITDWLNYLNLNAFKIFSKRKIKVTRLNLVTADYINYVIDSYPNRGKVVKTIKLMKCSITPFTGIKPKLAYAENHFTVPFMELTSFPKKDMETQ